ncbi:hypothetical protein EDD17DRAFT_1516521 [Pisolithus thermaeus]|nr:hypothetical protein EV401DRAFT_1883741 [Pisolithus croceorrhizus]KAI6139850.1 hypothetical protein EDD17DRAFT_1516521 [Pisolithus thermaeus]
MPPKITGSAMVGFESDIAFIVSFKNTGAGMGFSSRISDRRAWPYSLAYPGTISSPSDVFRPCLSSVDTSGNDGGKLHPWDNHGISAAETSHCNGSYEFREEQLNLAGGESHTFVDTPRFDASIPDYH